MNKKYLIGIYQISKQNTYIVAHVLYSYALKPVGLTQPQNKVYTFAIHGLACVTIQSVRYYVSVLL